MGLSILNRSKAGATQETPATAAESLASPREVLSLDGPWQFHTENAAESLNKPRISQVPGCWESQFPDLRGWAGSAVYERAFNVPEAFRGKRVLLRFDAVDFYTEAWVNDEL